MAGFGWALRQLGVPGRVAWCRDRVGSSATEWARERPEQCRRASPPPHFSKLLSTCSPHRVTGLDGGRCWQEAEVREEGRPGRLAWEWRKKRDRNTCWVTPCLQSPPKADTSEITSVAVCDTCRCWPHRNKVLQRCGEGIINCGNGEGTLQKEMQGLGRK